MRIEVKQNRQDNHNFFVVKYENIEEWNIYKSWFEGLLNATQSDIFDNGQTQDFLRRKSCVQEALNILDHCYHNDKYDKDNEVGLIISTSEMLSIFLALFEMIASLNFIVLDIKEALSVAKAKRYQEVNEVLGLAIDLVEAYEKYKTLDTANTVDLSLTEMKEMLRKCTVAESELKDIHNRIDKIGENN